MSFTQIVLHEIMAYEKLKGKKPSMIVFCNRDVADKFFKDIGPVVFKTEGLDFKTPGEFYGVPFRFKSVWQYNGSCDWMLLGEE